MGSCICIKNLEIDEEKIIKIEKKLMLRNKKPIRMTPVQ
jgi:hypothetical protein